MSLYKKIKDTFNPPPSLKGEDWLVPSDDLFDSIEYSIYNDRRKKSRGVWLWLISLLFISGMASYFFTPDNKSDVEYTNNGTIEENSTMNTIGVSGNEENKAKLGNLSLKDNTTHDEIAASKVESIVQKSIASPTGLSTLATLDQPTKVFLSSIPVYQIITENIKYSNLKDLSLNTANKSNIEITEISSLDNKIRNNYNLAKITGINSFLSRDNESPISNISPLVLYNSISDVSNWNFKLSTGTSHWNFDLNNNYLTALEPADFSFSNGIGYFVELGIEKRLNKRVSLGISGIVERNSFDSGHNSIIDYNINNENADHTNEFNLIMASPLGFLESNIVVARNADANDHTDLTIDLNNSHTVTNIDLGLYAQIDMLQYRKFSIGSQIGGGLNHLTNIINSLDHFSTSEAGFVSHSSEISEDQSNLNHLRPYINIGVNLEYQWSNSISIGLNHQFRQDFNAIYSSGDFSTLVGRQLSGFYVKKNL